MLTILGLRRFFVVVQKATKHLGPYGIDLVVRVNPIIFGNSAVEKVVRQASEYAVGDQDEEPRSKLGRDSEKLRAVVSGQCSNQIIKLVL